MAHINKCRLPYISLLPLTIHLNFRQTDLSKPFNDLLKGHWEQMASTLINRGRPTVFVNYHQNDFNTCKSKIAKPQFAQQCDLPSQNEYHFLSAFSHKDSLSYWLIHALNRLNVQKRQTIVYHNWPKVWPLPALWQWNALTMISNIRF